MIARSFFERDPITCARELIGCQLVWGTAAGLIVETEAYLAQNDEACHCFMRPSAREFVAREPTGTAYVYLNYGVHWLLNVLVKGGSEDGFVLIRALEPTRGLAKMQERRRLTDPRALCSGPGKLTQALGVTGADHGRDLCARSRFSFHAREATPVVISDVRIGISKAAHLPWRFLVSGSRFVSVPVRGASGHAKSQVG